MTRSCEGMKSKYKVTAHTKMCRWIPPSGKCLNPAVGSTPHGVAVCDKHLRIYQAMEAA